MQPTSWMRLVGGLRAETFTFDVRNRCATCADQPSGRTSSGIVLPKINLILGPWANTEIFANYGEGITATTHDRQWPQGPHHLHEPRTMK